MLALRVNAFKRRREDVANAPAVLHEEVSMRIPSILLGVVACLGIAGCAKTSGGLSKTPDAVLVTDILPRPDRATLSSSLPYHLGPSDKVTVQFFGAPDLDRTATIDPSGNLDVPLIGSVRAGDRTPQELGSEIARLMKGRYLRNPDVTVTIDEARSQQVTVDGAVKLPGVYPVTADLTLQQAIATARGLDEYAKVEDVVIYRTVNGKKMAALYDLRKVRQGELADPQIYGNDIIVVADNAARRQFRDAATAIAPLGVFTQLIR